MRRVERVGLGFGSVVVALALAVAPARAEAAVRLEGDWKDAPKVSLDLASVSRGEAINRVAEKAGLSVVANDIPADVVHLRLADQPLDKVLGVLLPEGDWVAKRDGTLITIERAKPAAAPAPAAPSATAAAAPEPPSPAEPPEPPPVSRGKKERNVEVFGNSLRIAKDDVVHDVTVFGGSVEIEGTVTGDLAIVGGDAHVKESARIEGDASVTGGHMKVEPGAVIEGDLGVMGGEIEGVENAKIAGSVKLDPGDSESKSSVLSRVGHRVAESVRTAALLFFLGTMFLALGGERAEQLRSAIAERPMRSIALGVVGLLGSVLALGLVALTVVGIPFAAVGAILGVLLLFAGITTSLTVIGAMLWGHRSKNPYVHLAIGCALFMVAGLIPVLGGLLQAAAIFAGIGGLVTTRALGLLVRRPRFGAATSSPYR